MARTVESVVTEKKDTSTNGVETNSQGELSRTPKAGPASKTGRKRNSSEVEISDPEEGSSTPTSGKMKKARGAGPPAASDPKLAPRIKKWLEENRNQKFIDVEGMASALHETYPEYQRKKLRQFRIQVDSTFKGIRDSAQPRPKSSSKSKKTEALQAVSSEENEVMDADAALTVVKGKMNSTLTNMYGGKNGDKNGASNTPSKSNSDCVIVDQQKNNGESSVENIAENIIDIDDDVENGDKEGDINYMKIGGPHKEERKKIGTPLNNSTPNSFELTKEKARLLAESLSKKKGSGKKAPSKNLSSFMSKSINESSGKDEDVVEVVEDPSKSNNSVVTPQKIQSRKSSANAGSSSDKDSSNKKQKSSNQEINMSTVSDSSLQPCSSLGKKRINNSNSINSEVSNEIIEIDKSRSESASTPAKDLAKQKLISELNGTKRPVNESWTTKKRKKESTPVAITESSTTFSDFGGNDSMLCEVCKLLVHLKHPEVYLKLGVTPPRGFLLHGPPGCGKTLLAHAIAGELQLPFIKVAAPEVISGVSGDSESKIRDLFEQAAQAAPCVLFIDEIDSITPKRENAQKEMERRIVAQLLTCMDDLGKKDCHVVVIGATNRPDALDPALRRAGRFDREIAIGIPDQKARRKILDVILRGLRLSPNTDLEELASLTPGYVGADLASLAREAAIAAVNRVFGDQVSVRPSGSSYGDTASPMVPSPSQLSVMLEWLQDTPPLGEEQLEQLFIEKGDWKVALTLVQPSAKREGFATVPDVTWDDVGALQNIREELQLAILAPIRHVAEYQSLGLSAPAGVLLAGPPGCGKTLVAKAVANEAGINFISVKGPELLNMYVGESERAVRACFQRGRNSAPCVIFFDELDSLCPRRSGSSSDGGSSSRVVNQLLTEMDGVESRKGVFLMAATNRPDILDPAVLRPGRLDKILYVGFPTPPDRMDILKALTKNGTKPSLEPDVDLAAIGRDQRCEGFSGADMSALVREASMSALKQHLKWKSTQPIVVSKEHFNEAFQQVKPSVSGKDRQKYDAMKLQYGTDDRRKGVSSFRKNPVVPSKVIIPETVEKVESERIEIRLDDEEEEDIMMEITQKVPINEGPKVPINEGPIYDSGSVEKTVQEQVHEVDVPQMQVSDVPVKEGDVVKEVDKEVGDVVKEVDKEVEAMEIDKEDGEYISSVNIEMEKDNLRVPVPDETANSVSSPNLADGLESASDISDDDLKDDETSLSSEDEGLKSRQKKVEEVIDLDTDSNESRENVPNLPPPVSAMDRSCSKEIMLPKPVSAIEKKLIENFKSDNNLVVAKTTEKNLEVVKTTEKNFEVPKVANKSQDSNDPLICSPRDGLRFLEGMEIRVKDKCIVGQVAGKTGFVDKVSGPECSEGGVLVMLENNCHQLVPSTDLEPFIPEEGDNAKCLQWGQREDVAEVVSVDEDEDTALVRYGGDKATDATMQLDHLCRITNSRSHVL